MVHGSRGAVAPNLADGRTFGTYRIVRKIGSGGMGHVHEAVHEPSGRRVALKVMSHRLDSQTDRRRFLREGRLAASVTHPNTLYIFGSEEIEGRPVIVTELVRAGTLKDRVEEKGALPVVEAVDAILQVIEGLEAAEATGVLHRDVKPANCFVDTDGTVKVGDFGLSISTQARPESMLTATGTLMGTPSFASPEQLRGEPLDLASDLYSVGATLYYLLTGRAPHQGGQLVHLITQVLQDTPDPPHRARPDVPRGLSRVVMRCLAKSRTARYVDYAALRRALTPWSSATETPATLGRRSAAGLVDGVLLMAVYLVPGFVEAMENVGRRIPGAVPLFLAYVLVTVLYYAIPEGIWGATPGKAMLGLSVRDVEGGSPGLRRASIRSLIFNANEYLPGLVLLALWPSPVLAGDPERWIHADPARRGRPRGLVGTLARTRPPGPGGGHLARPALTRAPHRRPSRTDARPARFPRTRAAGMV